ncbi:MAG: undecaprenyldiphospho-muramoylpentapeptide beta-N-acetylglucosaminyltransferase [Pelagibacterales bacterium]|nr:undecaprenyldiphospho-muramoylpentapeptide beta-N-acetylglucosaminyltransferase [Pelagibacterales bacterium]
MSKKNKKIFISSGGTGGHIIPARCLAEELSNSGYEVTFFGDEKYRNYIKPEDKFKSYIIQSSQIEKKPLKLAKATFKICIGILQCFSKIIKNRPNYVVTFGGYSTFPILIASIFTKTEIILHEQNSHLGKVNRIFAKYAKKIALSFAETSGIDAKFHNKLTFVGNPVRQEIIDLNKVPYQLPRQDEVKEIQDNKMGYNILLASDFKDLETATNYQDKLFNILIIGGSGGAKIFSEILPKAFFNLNEELKNNINIMQQCRKELVKSTFSQYKSFNLNVEVKAFFSDMPEKIKTAHLIIGRSGSSSIFEFCAAKKPMILVPFANSADNHQEKNASFLEKNKAAIVIREEEFTINKIGEILKDLIGNEKKLQEMSQASNSLAIINATKNLANLVTD